AAHAVRVAAVADARDRVADRARLDGGVGHARAAAGAGRVDAHGVAAPAGVVPAAAAPRQDVAGEEHVAEDRHVDARVAAVALDGAAAGTIDAHVHARALRRRGEDER